MQADRREWLEQQELNSRNNGQKNGAASVHMVEMLRQASVKSEHLTNDESWNYYLTLIQEWINKTTDSANKFRMTLESPDLVNTDARKQLENYLLICNERLSLLNAVIALPNQIMEDHENTKLKLNEVGEVNKETQ